MTHDSKEIEKMIDNITNKIDYFQSVRDHATKEIQKLLNAKSDLINTYRDE